MDGPLKMGIKSDIYVPCDCSFKSGCYNQVDEILGWPKYSFRLFRKMLQKTLHEFLANPIESVDCQPLSPATSVLAQWAPEYSDKEGGYM